MRNSRWCRATVGSDHVETRTTDRSNHDVPEVKTPASAILQDVQSSVVNACSAQIQNTVQHEKISNVSTTDPPSACKDEHEGTCHPRRVVYTVGTWRVSREMYLQQFRCLSIKLLVDIRGNPCAGRQEDMWRGKDLSAALQGAGVRYEYWGATFGEDQMLTRNDEGIRKRLKGMLASASPGPICLLGHMHEPHKCHRLQLCSLFPAECRILHLTWVDHCNIRVTQHLEALNKFESAVKYFYERKNMEQKSRTSEWALSNQDCGASSSSVGRWRGEERRRGERACTMGKQSPSTHNMACSLPVARWEDFSETQWEELLRNGKSYRLILPWDTELLWYPLFLARDGANELDKTVKDKITPYHPTYSFQTANGFRQEKINRKGQAKICDDFNFLVQYSSQKGTNHLYNTTNFEDWSRTLLRKVELASETVFNSIWFNQYRDGTVTIHWHTDSDEGLGPDPIIGSLSLGATREFCFKSKRTWPGGDGGKIIHMTFPLFNGSLLVMGRNSQVHWLHAVPAMEGVQQPRTNLTFRFYAHEDLAVAPGQKGNVGDQASSFDSIYLRNSKLVREPMNPTSNTACAANHKTSIPTRILLQPARTEWSGISNAPWRVLVDVPSHEITVGEFTELLQDAVLPMQFRLASTAVHTEASDGHQSTLQLLDAKEFLLPALRHANVVQDGTSQLLLLPSAEKQANHVDASVLSADKQLHDHSVEIWSNSLSAELVGTSPGSYSPPDGDHAVVALSDGGDWVRDVLQSLSGIQRRSKGKGQLARHVFHQCSQFAALYAGSAKSTVHLVLTPKRLLERNSIGPEEAPLLQRLGEYADFLTASLARQFPHLRFAAGVRLRRGRCKQLHAHLMSMDLVAPRAADLARRHFDDFLGGESKFLPIRKAAAHLADIGTLPEGPVQSACTKALICHRCGQFFGDAVSELVRHLTGCKQWRDPPADFPGPECRSSSSPPSKGNGGHEQNAEDPFKQVEAHTLREVAILEEMGFGSCGRDALYAALVAEGSIERVVEVLAAS